MKLNINSRRDALEARKKINEFLKLCGRDESIRLENVTYVDLGLPSGTLWADRNVSIGPVTHFTYEEATSFGIDSLPEDKQFKELRSRCSWKWDPARKGYRVTGCNGNSVFLPADGCVYDNHDNHVGMSGYYWSSTPVGNAHARYLLFASFFIDPKNSNPRNLGYSVRLVRKIR